ncbi:MAG: TetR/AcrR family transcriptional regulator [Pseudomonadota bacterium]
MNDRQSQIMDAAIGLFLKDGVGVSTAAIAKAAGVSNGTLFHAFPTKQALIDHIYLSVKASFFAAIALREGEAFNRAALKRLWRAHLTWARANPQHNKIKRLLFEAGLASPDAQTKADAMGLAHLNWMSGALDRGQIRGPSIGFIAELTFVHIDLVIDQSLTGADADLAFDMLCNAIGLDA